MLPAAQTWNNLERHTLIDGYRARFIHTDKMTFSMVSADAGKSVPQHAHPHEQVTYLLDGEFELTVGGQLHHMKAGDVVIIPSNMPHSAKAITHCEILDVFTPRREDYVQANFAIMQGKK